MDHYWYGGLDDGALIPDKGCQPWISLADGNGGTEHWLHQVVPAGSGGELHVYGNRIHPMSDLADAEKQG